MEGIKSLTSCAVLAFSDSWHVGWGEGEEGSTGWEEGGLQRFDHNVMNSVLDRKTKRGLVKVIVSAPSSSTPQTTSFTLITGSQALHRRELSSVNPWLTHQSPPCSNPWFLFDYIFTENNWRCLVRAVCSRKPHRNISESVCLVVSQSWDCTNNKNLLETR